MTDPFKVSMVGPTAVGKTTLVSAILDQTQSLLRGTPVEVAADEETEHKLATHRKQLAMALAAQEFEPHSLGSTQTTTEYTLELRSIDMAELSVPFSVLDFPGGWLDPLERAGSPQAKTDWPRCENHIRQSIMLVVPVDAAVLMETTTGKERAARVARLGLTEVHQVVKQWARLRNQAPDEPAVLVLAPLKCEKYFSDNGRRTGYSGVELAKEVRTVYADVLAAVRDEATKRAIRVVYSPIDTYGCVELSEAFWEPAADGILTLRATYRFRGDPPRPSIRAAATVVQELCQAIISARREQEAAAQAATTTAVAELTSRRAQRKGLIGTLAYHLSGEAGRVTREIESGTAELIEIETRHEQLAAAMESLATRARDARVEVW